LNHRRGLFLKARRNGPVLKSATEKKKKKNTVEKTLRGGGKRKR